MAEIQYLTIDDVLRFHLKVLENTVEDAGISPDMSLGSALNRIDDHVYYTGLNDLFEIAALYAIAIAKGHCFQNGNKRTGMVSMASFLFLNGIDLNADDKEIEDIMVDVVEDKITQQQLAQWLKANSEEFATA